MKEQQEKASKELVDLEKERNTIQEECTMLGEEHSDLQTKLHKAKKENDQYQRSQLELTEEIEETKRHMRETETKLNNNMRENNTGRVKVLELEQELKGKADLYSAQISDLQAKGLAKAQHIETLENTIREADKAKGDAVNSAKDFKQKYESEVEVTGKLQTERQQL